jgi:hypothetical protein
MHVFFRSLVSIAILVGVFAGAIIFLFPAPCAKPIRYAVGTLDPAFKLSNDSFRAVAEKAENAWEKAAGKQLFTYDPTASFTINMVYDERQQRTDRAKKITGSLEKVSRTHNELKAEYDTAYAAYMKAKKSYEQRLASYKADLVAYNEKVAGYNKEGGASQDEYATLQQEAKSLADRWNTLEQDRQELNVLASEVNNLAASESQVVDSYNQQVEKLNDEFSGSREFEQGEYTGNAITIYEFTGKEDLQLVLEHEMGHALGIGHLANPNAVMYYKVDRSAAFSPDLTKDDIAALRAQCKKSSFDVFYERLMGFNIQGILKFIISFITNISYGKHTR